MFETYARHLLYLYACDIDRSEFHNVCPPNIKPQLVGYLGGAAGTGKSAVISALLDFPPYASPEQRREMDEWVEDEKELCRLSIQKHFQLHQKICDVRVNKRSRE